MLAAILVSDFFVPDLLEKKEQEKSARPVWIPYRGILLRILTTWGGNVAYCMEERKRSQKSMSKIYRKCCIGLLTLCIHYFTSPP